MIIINILVFEIPKITKKFEFIVSVITYDFIYILKNRYDRERFISQTFMF